MYKYVLYFLLVVHTFQQCGIIGCSLCPDDPNQCISCDVGNGFYLSLYTCCDTNSGQFPDGFGGCDSCGNIIPNCDTCLVNGLDTECLGCEVGFTNSGNMACCDDAVGASDGNGGCLNCPFGCISCSVQTGNYLCTLCIQEDGYYNSGGLCCDQNLGVFPVQPLRCGPCSEAITGCLACKVDGKTQLPYCSVCDTGYELGGGTCCLTGNDQYPDGFGECASCVSVIPGCLSCVVVDEATECISCNKGMGYEISGGTCCSTSSGSFPDGADGCESCGNLVSGCTTCTFSSGTISCSACDTGNNQELSGSICCDTSSDAYPDGQGGCRSCSQVVPGCSVCSFSSGQTQCLTCNTASGYQLSGTTCCHTPSDSYPDGSDGCDSCFSIVTGCTTCSVNSGLTSCTACNTGMGYEISGGTCCSTSSGSFPDGADGCESCGNLVSGCTTCTFSSGTISCSACDTGNNQELSGSICCDTSSDAYPDGQGGCRSCSQVVPGCSVCSFSSGQTQCLTCNTASGYQLSGTTCCHTPSDSYPDGSDGCDSCFSIVTGCTTCSVNSGLTSCTACNTGMGYEISGGTCCSTSSGSFPDGADGCESCGNLVSGCTTCTFSSGTISCSACDTGNNQELSGSICCDTSSDAYPDGQGGCRSCSQVVPGCSVCSFSSGQTQCLTCNTASGYQLSGTTCCHTPSDSYPDGSDGCDSCFSIVTGCTTCSVNSGLTSCTACNTGMGYEISGGTCCSTSSGSFPDGADGCESCGNLVSGCTTCTFSSGTISCSACDTGNNQELSGSICCDTSSDAYPDGQGGCRSCSQVVPGCSVCSFSSGQTQCLTCNTASGYQLSGTTCCHTPSDSYPDGSDGCDSCFSIVTGCTTCSVNSGLTSCTACDLLNGYQLSGTTCCSTAINQFPNGSGGCDSCSSLISGCSLCSFTSGTTTCSTCDTANGYIISGSTCCHTTMNSYPDGAFGCDFCSAIIQGCTACTVSATQRTECVSCDTSGYEISGNTCCNTDTGSFPNSSGGCSSCSTIITGCSSCQVNSGVTECTVCDTGSGYEISGVTCCLTSTNSFPDGAGGCASCSMIISGCLNCDYSSGATVCLLCSNPNHYYISGTTCCDGNAGLYPDGSDGCESCSDVVEGCLSCVVVSATVQCDLCDRGNGYEISGHICCLTTSGSYPDGSGCGPCSGVITGCETCTVEAGITECDACDEGIGYYLSGQACCDSNAGFYPDGENGCNSCSSLIEGCSSCSVVVGATECRVCGSGYQISGSICCEVSLDSYPNGSNGCSSCSSIVEGCSICSVVLGVTGCAVCEPGYAISGSTCCQVGSDSYPDGGIGCDSCSQIIPGCVSCTVNSGSTECLICDTVNSYELSGGICCQTNVNSYPDGSGGCSSCSSIVPGCLSCDVFDGTTDCIDCSIVDLNCQVCDSLSSCKVCAFGYHLSLAQDSCINCRLINTYCDFCEDTINCLACDDGFALTSPTICQQCSQTQYVNENGDSCLPCTSITPNCYSCSDSNTCTRCMVNYALESPTTCTGCTINQVISSDLTSCIACTTIDPQCEYCSSQGVCSSCYPGYIVSGFDSCQFIDCLRIHAQCKSCTGVVCDSCVEGFVLADDFTSCIPCFYNQTVSDDGLRCVNCASIDVGCVRCSDESTCTLCDEGYIQTSPTECSLCPAGTGVSLSGTECINCNTIDINCISCSNQFTCSGCSAQYILYLSTNQCLRRSDVLQNTICGNGYQVGEECDDGNSNSDDGCSYLCTVQADWYCENYVGYASVCSLLCGNAVDDGEQCDDGNDYYFDGCDGECRVEDGWVCTGMPSVCVHTCGNGRIDSGEQCDDGNMVSVDGCSGTCDEEEGWLCREVPSSCDTVCGDSKRYGDEQCDNGPSDERDGCTDNCQQELGWKCEGRVGEKSACRQFPTFCGNGVYEYDVGEQCDDGGNVNGDGCSSSCKVQVDYVCMIDSIPNYCSKCGNGRPNEGQICDDGNFNNNDGCSDDCKFQIGFECVGLFPPICVERICFDGVFDAEKEGCDDGNIINGDGCDNSCEVEPGWECFNVPGATSSCSLIPICGNGAFQSVTNEGCDDGNLFSGDGCDNNCFVQPFFDCLNIQGERSICQARQSVCGDGWQSIEQEQQCDDGNFINGDGCNSTCWIEVGWECIRLTTMRSFCRPKDNYVEPPSEDPEVKICGDGRKEELEECDDGNLQPEDGCSQDCKVEDFYECFGEVGGFSFCRHQCGNFYLNEGEQCDDGNRVSGDGCTDICTSERGYFCNPGYQCVKVCGNGELDYAFDEVCDDGNKQDGDGCSSTCEIQSGWKCTLRFNDLSLCQRTCGNGIFEPSEGELCDDGNFAAEDGCFSCQIESGWVCRNVISGESECSSAVVGYCGNGRYDPEREECDDGNNINTDGCSNDCRLNSNFVCVNVPGQTTTCGATEPQSQQERICVDSGALVDFLLVEEEIQALSATQFSQARTIRDLVTMVVTKDPNGEIVENTEQYTQALGLFYARELFYNWWRVDYYVKQCTGES